MRYLFLLPFVLLIGAGCEDAEGGNKCDRSIFECSQQLTPPGKPEVVPNAPPAVPEPTAVLTFGIGVVIIARKLSRNA